MHSHCSITDEKIRIDFLESANYQEDQLEQLAHLCKTFANQLVQIYVAAQYYIRIMHRCQTIITVNCSST